MALETCHSFLDSAWAYCMHNAAEGFRLAFRSGTHTLVHTHACSPPHTHASCDFFQMTSANTMEVYAWSVVFVSVSCFVSGWGRVG